MDPLTVQLHWPDDPDRGMEGPYGPFANIDEVNTWITQCEEAASAGWQLLIGAHYLIAAMKPPFDPTTLWEIGTDAAH